jgi:hypothetical protein
MAAVTPNYEMARETDNVSKGVSDATRKSGKTVNQKPALDRENELNIVPVPQNSPVRQNGLIVGFREKRPSDEHYADLLRCEPLVP